MTRRRIPAALALPKAMPLTSFLGVPLIHGDKVIGLIALANREGGYRRAGTSIVEALAPAMVEAFYRSRAEAALRSNEARLRLALDAAKSGTWEWDLRSNSSIGLSKFGDCLVLSPIAFSLLTKDGS